MSDRRQVLEAAEKALEPFAKMAAKYAKFPLADYVNDDINVAALLAVRSALALIRALLAEGDPPETTVTEAEGTFACPICGLDKPHYHPPEQVAAYREDQVRNDGWISDAHRQPKESGWYMCLGVAVDPDQYGKSKDVWDNSRAANNWRQLSWFKWVRDAGANHRRTEEIPEVLYFDKGGIYGPNWQLRNFLGDAVPSGKESRFPVHAQPKYWRDLPCGVKPS